MRFPTIFLLLISVAAEAEIGVDVGFKFSCNEPESLTLASYVGPTVSPENDGEIVMKPETKTCKLGEYVYTLMLNHHEARGYGAGGGQRTLSIELSINDRLIFKHVDFANPMVDSINKIEIKSGKYGNPVKVCGKDSLRYSRVVEGCVTILAKDLFLLEGPTADPISKILSYARQPETKN